LRGGVGRIRKKNVFWLTVPLEKKKTDSPFHLAEENKMAISQLPPTFLPWFRNNQWNRIFGSANLRQKRKIQKPREVSQI